MKNAQTNCTTPAQAIMVRLMRSRARGARSTGWGSGRELSVASCLCLFLDTRHRHDNMGNAAISTARTESGKGSMGIMGSHCRQRASDMMGTT